MVLSNKKLKQKLRAALTESIATSITTPEPNNPEPDSHSKPQSHNSLKQLLDSVSQKPRLSKREKRRQTQTPTTETVNKDESSRGETFEGEIESGDGDKKKKKENKKKKRNREDGEEKIVKEEAEEKKVKKKKAKKMSKKKKQKKEKEKENKSEGEKANTEERVVETDKNKIGGESQVQEEVATKVYVGGIPYYSTEDDIRSYFEGCGTITEVDCMMFPDSGKFRGIAIISFKTEGAAKRSLALDGSEMGGLSLKIQPYKTTRAKRSSDFAPKIVEGYNRIYIGNLSYDITEDELRKLFSDCCISSIRWGMDKETGEFRGYAHVDFADSLSLTLALKLDQHVVCGRPVKISCAVPLKGVKTHSKVGTAPSKSMPLTEAADTGGMNSVPAATIKDADNSGISAGKMRRRTCYLCKEKGHLSSDCPKKQTADPSIANAS